jgi:hypothetical protein
VEKEKSMTELKKKGLKREKVAINNNMNRLIMVDE